MRNNTCLNDVTTPKLFTAKTTECSQQKLSIRTKLSAAVLAGLTMAGATIADAVYLSPNGVGQALIYPYYTVRNFKGHAANRFDTYISIANQYSQPKAIRVNFLEGRRGVPVLSFNLFLSGYDMWAGALLRTSEGALLISNDQSCTVPANLFALKDPASPAATTAPNALHFSLFSDPGAPVLTYEGGIVSDDRTREGYIEVIEMGEITEPTQIAAAQHNANGVPGNCALFDSLNMTLGNTLKAPSGGLFGRASLLSATSGAHFAYDATALAQWSDVVKYAPIVSAPAPNEGPHITDASPPVSQIMMEEGMVQAIWKDGADAVSAVLTQTTLANEFVLDSGTLSGTDWVITFPTKAAYVSPGLGKAKDPFISNYNNGSCHRFDYSIYNRESTSFPPTLPPPLGLITPTTLCWATNVLSFDGRRLGTNGVLGAEFTSNLLGSSLKSDTFPPLRAVTKDTIQNGWMRMNLQGYAIDGMPPAFISYSILPPLFPTRSCLCSRLHCIDLMEQLATYLVSNKAYPCWDL